MRSLLHKSICTPSSTYRRRSDIEFSGYDIGNHLLAHFIKNWRNLTGWLSLRARLGFQMLELLSSGPSERGLRVKPGLIFLLRLAWESRARLPLLIMSGFMALGVRVQMEINIERAASYMPRLRLQEEEPLASDSEDGSSDWTTDEAGFDTDYFDDDEDEEDDDDDDEES